MIRWILFKRRWERRTRVLEQARCLNASRISGGLDVKVIETFPVFVHPDDVKNIRNVLECALCLEIFRDGDALRILPCDHVFHSTDCIDYWLFNVKSSTCPVCRFNLTDNVPENTLNAGNVVIDVMEDGQEPSEMVTEIVSEEVIDSINPNNEMNPSQIRIPQSHSTVRHSLAQLGPDDHSERCLQFPGGENLSNAVNGKLSRFSSFPAFHNRGVVRCESSDLHGRGAGEGE
ncbi:hypothetical protein MKW92_009813 [Papaver armeniacum]|nr:hypothetical protein MKW92_009813 [Papaver armeniacum]